MTIKPIDFQITIPKTSELSKIQNEDNQRSNIHHHQISSAMQQQTEHDLKKVNSTDRAFEGKIKEKQKDQQKGKSKKKFSNEEKDTSLSKKSNKEEQNSSNKGSIIDIQI